MPSSRRSAAGSTAPARAIESLAGSWSAAYERSSRATQEQLARTLNSLKDALDLLNVSMEQGNALYRNIVKKMFDERIEPVAATVASRSAWRERAAGTMASRSVMGRRGSHGQPAITGH